MASRLIRRSNIATAIPQDVRVSKNEEDYPMDVQKMISYKGVIRPITVTVKNKREGGGTYKMRIINIYVKPNEKKTVMDKKTRQKKDILKEYTRNYEENVYNVSKRDIAKGSSDDNYYPDKARWSKISNTYKQPNSDIEPIPDTEPTPSTEPIVDTEAKSSDVSRKRRKVRLSINRLKHKKVLKPKNSRKCKCIKKR